MKRDLNGILLLDKPAGFSSNKILQKVKWIYQAKKAGHTGSLDPLATGMLPVCFGSATKISSFLLDSSKHYRVIATLGTATDTADEEGEVIQQCPLPALDHAAIEKALQAFLGESEQIPPMYSALNHQGKRLYELAREGKTVERAARTITLHALDLISFSKDKFELQVHCSKGTYIRTLVEDIAKELGSCAHVARLHRTVVDPFYEHSLVSFDQLEEIPQHEFDTLDALLLPPDAGLIHLPKILLDAEQSVAVTYGKAIEIDNSINEKWIRMYSNINVFLGIGACSNGDLQPRRMFVTAST